MNILMVSVEIPSPVSGGIGTSIANLYQYLTKKDFNITLLVSSRYIGKNYPLNTDSIIIQSFGRSAFEIISFGKYAAKFINKYHTKFDIIHLHLPLALGVLKYIDNSILNKTLVTFHTTYYGYKNMFKFVKWSELRTLEDILGKIYYYNLMSKFEEKISKKIKYTSAVSTGIANELKTAYGINNINIIPNGIDVSPTLKREVNEGKILFIGRLVVQKGILDLIKSIKILVNRDYVFELDICGTGYLKNIVQNYIKKLKLNKFVRLLGYVTKNYLLQLRRTAQIAVMPSLYEGLPMVGIELASAGLPIVATKTARIKDIVCDENKNLFVSPRDFKKFASNMEYFLNNLDESINIGIKNAKKCRDLCNINKVAAMYTKCYNELT